MFGRKKRALTHGQHIRDELAQSYGHLKLAAGHAAGGTAEMMTPAYDKARKVTVRGLSSTRGAFMPLYQQAKLGAAAARVGGREEKKNRWPAFFGILAAGAAVGAAGAVVVRRRRAAQWDYESVPPGAEPGMAAGTAEMKERASAAAGKVSAGAASVAESVSSGAGKVAESMRGKPGATAGKGPDIAPGETPGEATRRMNEGRGQGGAFSAFADEPPEGPSRP